MRAVVLNEIFTLTNPGPLQGIATPTSAEKDREWLP